MRLNWMIVGVYCASVPALFAQERPAQASQGTRGTKRCAPAAFAG
jgi:hypothetical protein